MNKEKFEFVKLICEMYQLEENKVQAMYQYGSHIYGRTTEESDVDVLIIYDSNVNKGIEDEKRKYSIEIITFEHFKEVMLTHESCFLIKLWLPERFIFKEIEMISHFKKNFVIDLKVLERETVSNAVNLQLGSRDKFNENKRLSIKKLVHAIRSLKFGIQISRDGGISDFECANEFFDEIYCLKFDNWKEYQKFFLPEYETLKKKFTEFISNERELKYKEFKNPKKSSPLVTLDVIKELDWSALIHFFSIQIKKRNGFNILENIEKFANFSHLIHKECNFLVLDKVIFPSFLIIEFGCLGVRCQSCFPL
jgi:predicted nucleotidyltransferase